jgi:hypothetical protein
VHRARDQHDADSAGAFDRRRAVNRSAVVRVQCWIDDVPHADPHSLFSERSLVNTCA